MKSRGVLSILVLFTTTAVGTAVAWANPASCDSRFSPEEATFLKKAGFTVCRLPLAPDLLFDPSQPAVPKPVIRSVDRAVRALLDAGLAVVFDPIHGSSSTAEWESSLYHSSRS